MRWCNSLPSWSSVSSIYATKTLHDELDKLINIKIIALLNLDEQSEWCDYFMCMNKPNGKVRLHIEPSKLKDHIKWPVHKGQWLEDILPKLANSEYFSIVSVKSGYWE